MGSALQAITPKRWRLPSLENGGALLGQLQDLADTFASTLVLLAALQHLDGRLISGLELAAGVATAIDHGLGRMPRGFIVVRCVSASANSLRETPSAPATASAMTFIAEGDGTFSVVVF
jgi:hypothetical protein